MPTPPPIPVLLSLLQRARPRRWRVLFHDDGDVPDCCAGPILRQVFHLSRGQCSQVLQLARLCGASTVITAPREVAESKALQACHLGRQAGFPLSLSLQPEG